MRILDCCSTFLTYLPDPSLPFLPACFLGTIFAALILLYLYKKETNLPLNDILLHMIRSLFIHLPSSGCSAGHSETDRCNSPQCVRCQKYDELQRQIGKRWIGWKRRANLEHLERVEQALNRLEGKGKMEENGKMSDDARNESEEERQERKAKEETQGKLKYRRKQRRHEDESSFLDKNEGQMKEWEKETDGVAGNKGQVQDERESTLCHQWNARNTANKRVSIEKDKKNEEKEGKQDWAKKKEKKQNKQLRYQKPTLFYMDLTANPIWNEYDIHVNELKLLKLNFELITQEYEAVFRRLQSGDATGWKNNSIAQGHWCIFSFVDQGRIVTSNCRRCPGVAEMILGCLPAMMNDCVFGNAAFSILYPDSHITSHHGPTNLRLRCHLGIKVPRGCWLEVAGQQYKWGVGETLLFDDSFAHSAHFMNQPSNVHSEPRAVLLLDFWHPDVSAKEKECLLELLAPIEEA